MYNYFWCECVCLSEYGCVSMFLWVPLWVLLCINNVIASACNFVNTSTCTCTHNSVCVYISITYHLGIWLGGMKKPPANPAIAESTGDTLWAYWGMAIMTNISKAIQVWLSERLNINIWPKVMRLYWVNGIICGKEERCIHLYHLYPHISLSSPLLLFLSSSLLLSFSIHKMTH